MYPSIPVWRSLLTFFHLALQQSDHSRTLGNPIHPASQRNDRSQTIAGYQPSSITMERSFLNRWGFQSNIAIERPLFNHRFHSISKVSFNFFIIATFKLSFNRWLVAGIFSDRTGVLVFSFESCLLFSQDDSLFSTLPLRRSLCNCLFFSRCPFNLGT